MENVINELHNENEKFVKTMLEFTGKIEDGTAEDEETEFPNVGNMADSIRSEIKDSFCTQIDFDTYKLDCNRLESCDFGLKNIFDKNFKLSDIFQNDKVIEAVLFAGIEQYDTQFFENDVPDVISNFHESLKLNSENCEISSQGTKVRLFSCGHLNPTNKEKCVLCENKEYKDIVITK